MLKLSKNIEYAILALKYLSDNRQAECINAKEISENANIPYELLSKILQKLTKENMIVSVQGIKGGYSLLSDPGLINILKIAEILEQNVQITDCMFENADGSACARVDNCCIRGPLGKLQDRINILFRETTLKDLIS